MYYTESSPRRSPVKGTDLEELEGWQGLGQIEKQFADAMACKVEG